MGLCKCPKRKVTNLFCFEHRVNVCEYCIVANHAKISSTGPASMRWPTSFPRTRPPLATSVPLARAPSSLPPTWSVPSRLPSETSSPPSTGLGPDSGFPW
uniref:Zinc finger protein-like 1 n=1 Tax=Pseudonaja textilis TaxID=8673 RepID=A0A670ZM40_PSETE